MAYPESEITILKDEEFLILLAASGLESWYGLELAEQRAVLSDAGALNSSLASLYQKEMIEWEDGKAVIADAYRPMFRALRDSRRCILVSTASRPDLSGGCYYCSGNIVNVERVTTAENEVELSMQSLAEWLGELPISGCLPDTAGTPEDFEELSGEMEPVSSFELRSVPEGELLQTMSLYEQGLYAVTEIADSTGVKKKLYRAEDVTETFRTWCGGNI